MKNNPIRQTQKTLFMHAPIGAELRFNGCRVLKLDAQHVKFLTSGDGTPIDYSKRYNRRYARTTQQCIEGTPVEVLSLPANSLPRFQTNRNTETAHDMKSTITIHTLPVNGGPFSCHPAMTHEIPTDRIAGCPVFFPWEGRDSADRLFVICNEFGAMGAVWADSEQDALDMLIDENLGGGIEVEEPTSEEEEQDISRRGNDGRPVDLTHCTILVAHFEPVRDLAFICACHEMRGSGQALSQFI